LEQFRFLRDGGLYINQATGQEEHFAGHLFDPVVFDDSVKEFLNLVLCCCFASNSRFTCWRCWAVVQLCSCWVRWVSSWLPKKSIWNP